MSLNEVRLDTPLLRNLYADVLIENAPANKGEKVIPPDSIAYLGNNGKKITIVVNVADTVYLPDDQLGFLMNILQACQLSMDSIALVNLASRTGLSFKDINTQLEPEKTLLFGTDPASIGLPIQFPFYQLQRYNNQPYLYAPGLDKLQSDKEEKLKLWNCLKQLFLTA